MTVRDGERRESTRNTKARASANRRLLPRGRLGCNAAPGFCPCVVYQCDSARVRVCSSCRTPSPTQIWTLRRTQRQGVTMKSVHSEEGLVRTRIAVDQVRLSRLATQNSIERSRHSLAETRALLIALQNALLARQQKRFRDGNDAVAELLKKHRQLVGPPQLTQHGARGAPTAKF